MDLMCSVVFVYDLFFFVKQKTAYEMRISDWSSDVCSSDLLNKSDNERSGVLSTAMSFLGLYRDPVVAEVTRRCDWRIVDIVGSKHPTTLNLVVPPSDINRTKPLIRLILNQVGRRLTEDLQAKGNRHPDRQGARSGKR